MIYFQLQQKKRFLIFDNSLYLQIDGVTMWSTLGPSLANAFLVIMKRNGQIVAQLSLSLIIKSVLFRCFSICSSYEKFQEEIVRLKEIFK